MEGSSAEELKSENSLFFFFFPNFQVWYKKFSVLSR